jgi:hypothetical protein
VRTIAGGLLVQDRDVGRIMEADLKVVTKRKPSPQEIADLIFAFRVCKHTKSNAIIYAKDGATVGIGAGQMSRVDSARIARRKAEDAAAAQNKADPATIGSVCASDAFFPFPDGLLQAAHQGAAPRRAQQLQRAGLAGARGGRNNPLRGAAVAAAGARWPDEAAVTPPRAASGSAITVTSPARRRRRQSAR